MPITAALVFKKMTTTEIRFCISSPPDRDQLVAEIFFRENQIAEINQELEDFHIEIYPKPDGEAWNLPIDQFQEIINEAKSLLIQKRDESKIEPLFSTNFTRDEWNLLKNAVLMANKTGSKNKLSLFDNLPENLRLSKVGNLIYSSVYLGHKNSASKAAKILTGGSEKAWLILSKS